MQLRPHQQEALAAIRAAAVRGERRMTVVAACGTGKTLIAQQAAQQLAPAGPVLVLMPTLALVTQTIERWREAGRLGPMLGVCSLRQGQSGLDPRTAVMTSSPHRIARTLLTAGPATVFATYGSVHRIQEAHEHAQLPPWDLVIADEAHRTCSAFGEGWGTVHDDAAIPAKTRIYMTATPRIWNTRPPADLAAFMEYAPTATMDREDIFGPTVFRLGLAEAIEREILADYQVLMPVVGDADLYAILAQRRPSTSAHHNGLRMAALQVAVLRAIAEHDLKRVLVFHNRVAAAHAFARTLPETAARVAAPLRIDHLWSAAIDGTQDTDYRRELLSSFADEAVERAVLSNVRVLNEGVDMPAVGAVVFADPRGSVIDAIQAIGRGLRQTPGSGKVATLVLPVYLPEGAASGKLLKGSAYKPLWTILQALRAHDDTYLDRIVLPATGASGATQVRRVSHTAPERAAELAHALGLEITLPATGSWEDASHSTTRYAGTHGHLDVPAHYVDPEGFALGEWIANQRMRRLLGRLAPDQERFLTDLGMHWKVPEQTFGRMYGHARAYAAEHHHLAAPHDATVGGHRVGQWLADCRTKARKGTLPREHERALASVDPWWNPPWRSLAWRRNYAIAEEHTQAHRHCDETTDHTAGTCAVPWRPQTAKWIQNQRKDFASLDHLRASLLLKIGIAPGIEDLYSGANHDPEHAEFRDGLLASRRFLQREGHLNVPRPHTEPLHNRPFPLGAWIHRHRRNPLGLTLQQRTALETLHMVWDTRLGRTRPPAPGRGRP